MDPLGTRAGMWGEAVPVADHPVPGRAGMLDCLTNEHNAFAIRLLQHAQFHVVSHRPTVPAAPASSVMGTTEWHWSLHRNAGFGARKCSLSI
jgi:hypothetical protein